MNSTTETVKLNFETAALAAALREVRGAVQRRNTIPILAHVLVETIGTEQVRLTATDTDVMVSRTVAAASTLPARFTVDAHRLADVVGAFEPGSQTIIEKAADAVLVKSGRARLRFSVLPAEMFPILAQPDVKARFTIDAKALSRGIGAVRHAISTEETRYYLNGIFWHASGGKLRYVATDGHRLARYVDDVPVGAEDMPDIILRTRCIELVRAAAEGRDCAIDVAIGGGKITMNAGDFTIVAKAVDGIFPDYTRVIPSNVPNTVSIDRDGLDGALARIAIASSDRTRIIKLDIEHDLVTASIKSQEHGDAVEQVPCAYGGPSMAIGFNAKYLRDALAVLDVDDVSIGMAGANDPTTITSPKASGVTLVLVPVRI